MIPEAEARSCLCLEHAASPSPGVGRLYRPRRQKRNLTLYSPDLKLDGVSIHEEVHSEAGGRWCGRHGSRRERRRGSCAATALSAPSAVSSR